MAEGNRETRNSKLGDEASQSALREEERVTQYRWRNVDSKAQGSGRHKYRKEEHRENEYRQQERIEREATGDNRQKQQRSAHRHTQCIITKKDSLHI